MTSNELKHKAKLQEWALMVQECRSSGKPVKQWCIENKIKATTYYRWEREILGDAGKSRNKSERNGTPVFAELGNKIKVTTYYRWEREILGTAGKNRNKPEQTGT